jgi:hypothetical protein
MTEEAHQKTASNTLNYTLWGENGQSELREKNQKLRKTRINTWGNLGLILRDIL